MVAEDAAKSALSRVLDLGKVPAADHFPLATEPVRSEEASHRLAMDVCGDCGLAQLADDDTVADEPRGVEPQALKDQAEAAIERSRHPVGCAGTPSSSSAARTVARWIPLLTERGFATVASQADVVLDCFGIMHEPDQRSAFAGARRSPHPGGVLAAAIPLDRHDRRAGPMECVAARPFCVLLPDHADAPARRSRNAALRPHGSSTCTAERCCSRPCTERLRPDESVQRILATEEALGITELG